MLRAGFDQPHLGFFLAYALSDSGIVLHLRDLITKILELKNNPIQCI